MLVAKRPGAHPEEESEYEDQAPLLVTTLAEPDGKRSYSEGGKYVKDPSPGDVLKDRHQAALLRRSGAVRRRQSAPWRAIPSGGRPKQAHAAGHPTSSNRENTDRNGQKDNALELKRPKNLCAKEGANMPCLTMDGRFGKVIALVFLES